MTRARGSWLSVAELAKRAREALDMTQDEFAALLGCRRQSVSRWEQGRRGTSNMTRLFFALLADDPERARRVLEALKEDEDGS